MSNANTREFALPPLPVLAWGILLGLPLIAVAAVALLPREQNTPVSIGLALLIVAVALVVPLLALRRRHIRLAGRELQVAATFYTRKIDVAALDLDKARIVDLAEHTEFAPLMKLNGYGLPGFKAGHFLLRSRARAFCLLIGDGRTLVLPQRDGKYLLLSPEQPQALLDALQRVAQAGTAR